MSRRLNAVGAAVRVRGAAAGRDRAGIGGGVVERGHFPPACGVEDSCRLGN